MSSPIKGNATVPNTTRRLSSRMSNARRCADARRAGKFGFGFEIRRAGRTSTRMRAIPP